MRRTPLTSDPRASTSSATITSVSWDSNPGLHAYQVSLLPTSNERWSGEAQGQGLQFNFLVEKPDTKVLSCIHYDCELWCLSSPGRLTWFGLCFGYPGERAFGDWSTQGELTEIEGAVHSWAVVVSRVLERNVMLNYSLGCFLRPG